MTPEPALFIDDKIVQSLCARSYSINVWLLLALYSQEYMNGLRSLTDDVQPR